MLALIRCGEVAGGVFFAGSLLLAGTAQCSDGVQLNLSAQVAPLRVELDKLAGQWTCAPDLFAGSMSSDRAWVAADRFNSMDGVILVHVDEPERELPVSIVRDWMYQPIWEATTGKFWMGHSVRGGGVELSSLDPDHRETSTTLVESRPCRFVSRLVDLGNGHAAAVIKSTARGKREGQQAGESAADAVGRLNEVLKQGDRSAAPKALESDEGYSVLVHDLVRDTTREFPFSFAPETCAFGLAACPATRMLAVTGAREDGSEPVVETILIDSATGKELGRHRSASYDVTDPAWSGDGSLLAWVTHGDDGSQLQVQRMGSEAGRSVRSTDFHHLLVTGAVFLPGTSTCLVETERNVTSVLEAVAALPRAGEDVRHTTRHEAWLVDARSGQTLPEPLLTADWRDDDPMPEALRGLRAAFALWGH